jgi:hypothetical protein
MIPVTWVSYLTLTFRNHEKRNPQDLTYVLYSPDRTARAFMITSGVRTRQGTRTGLLTPEHNQINTAKPEETPP